MRHYLIGDIHGCNETLKALLAQFELRQGDCLVFLGDYIDRGPDTKGVIDTIFQLQEMEYRTVCLRGNHEQMMLDGFEDPLQLPFWLNNGGRESLESFGLDALDGISSLYVQFVDATLPYWETDACVCVHGGLNFYLDEYPLRNARIVLWARNWYHTIDYKWLGPRIIVHGHTPMPIDAIRQQLEHLETQRYLNLDNGCVYAKKEKNALGEYGRLLGFCLETKTLYEQKYAE